MRGYKIKSLMKRDFKVFVRTKWRFVEIFYFPVTTVIIWGLFALFSKSFSPEAGLMILAVNVFWSFSYLAQSTTNMQMNQDNWSGSLKQILASGISEFEYIFARILSSTIVSIVIMIVMLSIAFSFGLVILFQEIGITITLIAITLVGSIALSIIVAALIMFFGREYSFLAWTVLQIFVLLSAPFYPLEILPGFFQEIAKVMPYSNVFLGVRTLIGTGSVPSSLFINGFLIVVVYLIVSIPLYYYSFRRARKIGLLSQMS